MSDLHNAIFYRDHDKLTRLIASGVDLEFVDGHGRTALCYATESMCENMVKAFLAAGANPNTLRTHHCGAKDDSSTLMIAAQWENSSILKMLTAAGAKVNYRRSICFGKLDNFSALDVALYRHNWTLAKLLVSAGADLSPPAFKCGKAHDWSPLMYAAFYCQCELVELMLEHGADVHYTSTKYNGNDSNWAAIHAGSRDAKLIRLLCRWGADPNSVARSNRKRTPLHMAAEHALPDTALALVVAGADPFGLDADGRTVLEAKPGNEVLLDSRPSVFD